MSRFTFPEPVTRFAIGFDHLLRLTETQTLTYPPHNIERVSEDHFRLSLAVAGFAPHELTISLHEGNLTVRGEKPHKATITEYLYQGISFRDFERQFKLGEFVEVTKAEMRDGLLIVDLHRVVPETQKPKLIPIG